MKKGKYTVRVQSTDSEEVHVVVESRTDYVVAFWIPEIGTLRKWGDSEHRLMTGVYSQSDIIDELLERNLIE